MHHQHVVLLRQRNHALEKIQLDALRGRVRGKTEDHHLRLRVAFADRPFQLVKEIDARHQRHRTHLRAGNYRAVNMNGVAGIRHQHGVAVIERRQHQMRQSLFRADGDDRLRFRIDIDRIAIGIPAGDGATQAWNAARGRVAVGVIALRHLTEFFHDMRRRSAVRVAHAEIDNIFAAPTRSHLQLSGNVEYVRGKAFNTGKTTRRAVISHSILWST